MTPSRSWVLAYAALCLLWGSSFLLISTALRSFVPTQVAAGRIAIGALVLVVLLVLRRQRVRVRRRVALDVLVVAVALSALPFMLIAEAQTRLTTVLAGMINATTPLFTAIFVVLLIPTERPDRGQLAGLLVGFLGISVLLGVWDAGSLDLVGALLMVGATTCYGFGTVWSRLRLSDSGLSPVALPAAQLSLAALLLLPFAATAPLPTDVDPWAAAALLALGVGGTGLAYVLFWHVLRAVGATVAASVTYVLPVVTTALGVLVLHEAVHWHEPVGGVIVLLGVALTQMSVIRAQRRLASTANTTAATAPAAPVTVRARRRRSSSS